MSIILGKIWHLDLVKYHGRKICPVGVIDSIMTFLGDGMIFNAVLKEFYDYCINTGYLVGILVSKTTRFLNKLTFMRVI